MIKKFLRKVYDRAFYLFSFESLTPMGYPNTWNVPDSELKNIQYVLSGGVGNDISFEQEMAAHPAVISIALFDPSITGKDHIASIVLNEKISYYPIGLSGECKTQIASPPIIEGEGSFRLGVEGSDDNVSFEVVDPQSAIELAALPRVDLLKIDIEGFEYEFLDALLEQKIFPAVIMVEYHHFYENISFMATLRSMLALRARGYKLVKKINNDCVYLRT